jgi:hypothetical protein
MLKSLIQLLGLFIGSSSIHKGNPNGKVKQSLGIHVIGLFVMPTKSASGTLYRQEMLLSLIIKNVIYSGT